MKHVKGLMADFNMGEGDIKLPREFTKLDSLYRLDILRDWKNALQQLYKKAHKEYYGEIK